MQQKKRERASPSEKKRRGGGKKAAKDPNAPKRAMSAYFLWLKDHRPEFVSQGLSVTEIAKAAGEKWKTLTDDDKKVP